MNSAAEKVWLSWAGSIALNNLFNSGLTFFRTSACSKEQEKKEEQEDKATEDGC